MSVRCPYICCAPGVVGAPAHGGTDYHSFLLYFQPQEIYIVNVFLCSVLLILSHATATTNTPTVTVVCSRTSPIIMMVIMAATSVGSNVSGWHDVVLSPQFIQVDTMRGSVCLSTVLQQQQPQSEVPSQA